MLDINNYKPSFNNSYKSYIGYVVKLASLILILSGIISIIPNETLIFNFKIILLSLSTSIALAIVTLIFFLVYQNLKKYILFT